MFYGKLALRSTTAISLNDRFTALRRTFPGNDRGSPRKQFVQASQRNRRLAQQMENRPSVIAALNLNKPSPSQTSVTTIKRRLPTQQSRGHLLQSKATSIKKRLAIQGRLTVPETLASRRGTFRGRGLGRNRGRGIRGRGGYISSDSPATQVSWRGTQSRGFKRGKPSFQARGFSRGSIRGSHRRGFSVRGRGRGGRIFKGNVPDSTREQLDSQLEDYMSKNKSTLNGNEFI